MPTSGMPRCDALFRWILGDRRYSLVAGRDELAHRPRLADDRRQLHAGGDQQVHGVRVKDPWLDRLYDQDALEYAAIDDRHAEKRSVQFLARFRKVLEA